MAYYVYTLILLLLISIFSTGSSRDQIKINQSLRDPETLESSNGIFKFGFFSPINSTNRYVGIWYNDGEFDDTLEVIWVANRENPLNHSTGVLNISEDGDLQLLDGQNNSIWSSNVTAKNTVKTSVAQLLYTGNLVLISNASKSIIWQSFDHPTDSLLLNMKLSFSENTSTKPLLVTWKSASDPSNGRFTGGINHRNLSEFFVWDGDRPYWRSGPWNGNLFMGVRALYYSAQNVGFRLENDNEGTLSFSFSSAAQRITEHYEMGYDGMVFLRDWDDKNGNWTVEWKSLETDCDLFGKCGEFGSCNKKNSPICDCLRGFVPRNNQEWSEGNWSSGCIRRTPLKCGVTGGEENGFLRLENMKVPDNAEWLDTDNEDDCRGQCLINCSCLAYAYYFGFGCMVWSESLIDIQEFSDVGVHLYIRLAHSELRNSTKKWRIIISVTVIMGSAALIFSLYYLWRCISKYKVKTATNKDENLLVGENMIGAGVSYADFQDLPLFNFDDLLVATNNFCESNKLGRGGFGVVYKGKSEDGREIAVKRLSRGSVQGIQEFMNEVVVISKLQHRNLVRLLGCCVEGEEKLLVYEYMPNKSLDAFLFNPSNRECLDWKKRLNIIQGISRGLLYLHRDSRLKIIHRDLKASNILLDDNLNPKISDFGLAKIFKGNEDQDDTKRIVGTYGYMSPEYAMEGRFSEKSDVFSFGVLLLEIVSGRRNSSFKNEKTLSLLGHAWKLWQEDNIVSLIDTTISECPFQEEILRCIQIGLLCVEDVPEDRPSITMVVSMIETENGHLPLPKQPGFTHRKIALRDEAQPISRSYSVNQVSISLLKAR